MRSYSVTIAGYNIRFESSDSGSDIVPSERFLRFLIKETHQHSPSRNIPFNETHLNPQKGGAEEIKDVPHCKGLPPQPPQGGAVEGREQQGGEDNDLIIRVHAGEMTLPDDAKRVFHAPFVEEINGVLFQQNPEFWSIFRYHSDLFIKIDFPNQFNEKNAILKFSLDSTHWDLWIDSKETRVDPFQYPLDGLILYYLTVINKNIMIHASGINNAGKGYLFSGVSGKGKTTISGLWNNHGAQVIHDDRLILRNSGTGYIMHNTPVYDDDEPRKSPLEKIFIIEHGSENKIVPVSGANAVSLVMANCIQQNWGPETVGPFLDSVSDLCSKVKVFKLSFMPDRRVIDRILAYE